MSNFPPSVSGHELLTKQVESYINQGYKEVDMQFNIGRVEGHDPWAYDLIKSGADRRLITDPSCLESEERVRSVLGSHAVLNRVDATDAFSVYEVPSGTRLLEKSMQTPAYEAPYMRMLAVRADRLLAAIRLLDPGYYGISANRIVVAHDVDGDVGGGDDAYLSVAPPLKSALDPVKSARRQFPVFRGVAGGFGDGARELARQSETISDLEPNELWRWLNERHQA